MGAACFGLADRAACFGLADAVLILSKFLRFTKQLYDGKGYFSPDVNSRVPEWPRIKKAGATCGHKMHWARMLLQSGKVKGDPLEVRFSCSSCACGPIPCARTC